MSLEIVFILVMLVVIFVGDLVWRWWRENEWKRHWRRERRERDED